MEGSTKLFFKKKICNKKIKNNKNLKKLENNLVLIYTELIEQPAKLLQVTTINLHLKKRIYIDKIISLVDEGEKLINSGNIDGFGELLNDGWNLKKKLSKTVSNKKIDRLYDMLIENGASGGKLF